MLNVMHFSCVHYTFIIVKGIGGQSIDFRKSRFKLFKEKWHSLNKITQNNGIKNIYFSTINIYSKITMSIHNIMHYNKIFQNYIYFQCSKNIIKIGI